MDPNNSEKPFISILLPIYNGEQFISRCLDSILSQTYKNFELIVIDDKSFDTTLKIIETFKDKRIKIYKNKKNLGLAQTLNRGINLSQSEIIVRIDQDDEMELNRLEKLINIFNVNKEAELILSTASIIDPQNKKIGYLNFPKNRRSILFISIFINIFTHSAAAFTRDSILRLGGYPATDDKNLPEDYYMWSQYIRQNKNNIIFLRDNLVKHRKHPKGFSSKNDKLNERASSICQKNIIFYLKSTNQSELMQFIARRLYNLKTNFRIKYISKTLNLLIELNRSINNDFKLNDISHIMYIYLRVFFPSKLKPLVLRLFRVN